jgi:hypothetical protein
LAIVAITATSARTGMWTAERGVLVGQRLAPGGGALGLDNPKVQEAVHGDTPQGALYRLTRGAISRLVPGGTTFLP